MLAQQVPVVPQPSGTGFLDPQKIAADFGVTQGMRIADFGCGSGEFAVILAKMVGENGAVNAVDIMESRLESVRAKAKSAGLNNIQTIRSNLEVLGSSGLDDGSQDIAVLVNILFQSPKKEDIVRESYRVLKEGGKLVVVDWKKGTGGGPPDELRTDSEDMKILVTNLGFIPESTIDAGAFHYGFIFKKTFNAAS